MPKMSNKYFAYFAPFVNSDEEVWASTKRLTASIKTFQRQLEDIGLRRQIHYCLKRLSKAEILDIVDADGHAYPRMVPLCEIDFRNLKSFEVFRSSGLADEADTPF